jgi:hypothetical protein
MAQKSMMESVKQEIVSAIKGTGDIVDAVVDTVSDTLTNTIMAAVQWPLRWYEYCRRRHALPFKEWLR